MKILKCTKANNSTFQNWNPMKNLRGHIRLDPLADLTPYQPIPDGAVALGTVTCGTSAPGALILVQVPCADFDETPYPFSLRHYSNGRWTRLPMRRTLSALRANNYVITDGDFVLTSPTS